METNNLSISDAIDLAIKGINVQYPNIKIDHNKLLNLCINLHKKSLNRRNNNNYTDEFSVRCIKLGEKEYLYAQKYHLIFDTETKKICGCKIKINNKNKYIIY